MKRLLVYIIFIFALLISFPRQAICQTEKIFNTKYSSIHYTSDKDINDFIWRLGGQKLELDSDSALVSNRVDRIVDRVENILDIRPEHFKIDIYLRRLPLESGRAAFYDNKTRSIYVLIDNVSDGVLAHEIGHAVIHQGLGVMLPSKMQEILAQYVDKYLWGDYN